MRIQRLSLDRFGHFTDRHFDFGSAGGGPDFHIIYGPNEAGKTTTMEAVLRLFYGFPMREGYAFKHPRNNLQVSATLEIDGATRSFTRLPKRGGALIDETGTALPEAALSAHLAGLSEQDYRRLLCLDDETIERGGEEIANAEGDIGRLLFSAAAGVADLSTVLDGVRERADALWKKRGRNTRMAELKRALAEVEAEIKDRDVTASAWKGLKRALVTAQEAEDRARRDRDGLNTAKAGMEAQKRALPLLAEIHDLEAAIAPCSDVPEQLDFDPERLIELRSDRGVASQNIARLTEELATLREQNARAPVDPGLIALSTALDDLADLGARDRTAQLDLERRQDDQKVAQDAMRQAARELAIAVPDEKLPRLVLSGADIATLETAREALRAATSLAETEAEEVAALRERVRMAEEALQDVVPAQDGRRVADVLHRFDADHLAPAHAAALQVITAARSAADRALSALSHGGVTFEKLPACPTTRLQASAWAERYQELTRDLRATTQKRDEHRGDAAARRAKAEALTKGAVIVPDTEVQQRRALRDARWTAHLAALDTATATDFHAAMQAHDTAVEMRLAQSRELAQLREIALAEAEADARAAQTDTQLATLGGECRAIEEAVGAAAGLVGLPAMTAAEWLDWVTRHEAALADAMALREAQQAHRATLHRAEDLLAALAGVLPVPPTDLASALASARRHAEEEQKQADRRTKAEETLKLAQRDLSRRTARQAEADTQKAAADAAWRARVRELLGEAIAPDHLIASLEPLRELREHEKARAAAERRVRTMQVDQAQFAEEVDSLARAHAQQPQATAAQTYAALKALTEEARTARQAGRARDTAIETAEAEKARNQQKLEAIDQEVEAIAAAFPDPATPREIDALRQLVARTQQVIANRDKLEKLRRQVLSEMGIAEIEAARRQLAGTSVAALEAQLDSNASDLAHAEEMLTRAIQDRVTAAHALAEVKGDARIAALVERKATMELELEETALAHLELSLGHRLASDAIRRYRDSHRSGMLAATERCFATLTRGAYPSLSAQMDKEAEVLLAVDRHGVSKRASEMSKGTRFQLYLALRAAAQEQLVAQGTRLPFFCDDIFETFDEARTSAACRVMETIGGRGQAIYLTHHRHVVEIARDVCTTPPVIHEM
ncbi:YhaN family protein [Pseudooceanicola aestuarii]|uniref:YhaN family protein n=1 Tax=Pseudooceanicola aestuarii TaxID=2697319 RepID=UPI0013D631AE|nr:YhaN family protein [Pseudooceanicola aestuarii]